MGEKELKQIRLKNHIEIIESCGDCPIRNRDDVGDNWNGCNLGAENPKKSQKFPDDCPLEGAE